MTRSTSMGWAIAGLVLFLAVGYWFGSTPKPKPPDGSGPPLLIDTTGVEEKEVQAEGWVGIFQAPFDWIKDQGFKLGVEIRPGNSIFVIGVDQDGNVTRAFSMPIKGSGSEMTLSFGQEGNSANAGGFSGQFSIQPDHAVTAIYLDGAGKSSRGYSYSIKTGIGTISLNLNPVSPSLPNPLLLQPSLAEQIMEESKMLGTLDVNPWKSSKFQPGLLDPDAYRKGQRLRELFVGAKLKETDFDKYLIGVPTPLPDNSPSGPLVSGAKIKLGELDPKVLGQSDSGPVNDSSRKTSNSTLDEDLRVLIRRPALRSALKETWKSVERDSKANLPPVESEIEPFSSKLPKVPIDSASPDPPVDFIPPPPPDRVTPPAPPASDL